jgi:exodeoxyribonuclease VII small subunit
MTRDLPEPSALSFEQALGELERIVAQLERGDVPLEDSLALYQRGAALRTHCENKLKGAQLKVEQIVLASDGVRVEEAKLA